MTDYPKANNCADFVLFCAPNDDGSWETTSGPQVLLIQRRSGDWAVPGGYMNVDEKLIKTAVREFYEETGIDLNSLNLIMPGLVYVGLYDDPKRDPRGRNISNAWAAAIDYGQYKNLVIKPIDSEEIHNWGWFDYSHLPDNMAFDHLDIIRDAYGKLFGGN